MSEEHRIDLYLQGLDIADIIIVVQWKVPKDLNTLIQRFGRAVRDLQLEGIAVLFAEPGAFYEGLLEAESRKRKATEKRESTQNKRQKTTTGSAVANEAGAPVAVSQSSSSLHSPTTPHARRHTPTTTPCASPFDTPARPRTPPRVHFAMPVVRSPLTDRRQPVSISPSHSTSPRAPTHPTSPSTPTRTRRRESHTHSPSVPSADAENRPPLSFEAHTSPRRQTRGMSSSPARRLHQDERANPGGTDREQHEAEAAEEEEEEEEEAEEEGEEEETLNGHGDHGSQLVGGSGRAEDTGDREERLRGLLRGSTNREAKKRAASKREPRVSDEALSFFINAHVLTGQKHCRRYHANQFFANNKARKYPILSYNLNSFTDDY